MADILPKAGGSGKRFRLGHKLRTGNIEIRHDQGIE
jgi:hypothetical protein